MAAASVVIVAVIALFLAGPSGSPTISFRLTSYAISTRDIVIYGKVTTPTDHAVNGAEVKIYRTVRHRTRTLDEVRTNSKGLYRLVLKHLSKVTLHEKIVIRFDKRRYSSAIRFIARPGHAYGVSVHLAQRGGLFFLPINSY